MYLFGFFLLFCRFSCLSSSSETSLHWFHRLLAGHLQRKVRLIHCKVLLCCIWKGFKAIVMLLGYPNGLVFLLIDSVPTKRNQREIGRLPTS